MRTHRSAFAHACAPARCSGIARTLGACRPARIWAEDRASTAVTAQATRPDAYVCIALLSYAVRCGMGSYAPPEHAGRKHFAGHKPKLLPPATQQARAGRRRRPPRRRCGASRRLRALQKVGDRRVVGLGVCCFFRSPAGPCRTNCCAVEWSGAAAAERSRARATLQVHGVHGPHRLGSSPSPSLMPQTP